MITSLVEFSYQSQQQNCKIEDRLSTADNQSLSLDILKNSFQWTIAAIMWTKPKPVIDWKQSVVKIELDSHS